MSPSDPPTPLREEALARVPSSRQQRAVTPSDSASHGASTQVIRRYVLHGEIATGGMATIHLGRLVGTSFSRRVAIKKLHPHLAKQTAFVSMLLDEARLCARIHHPNVVPTLDVVTDSGEVFLVLEHVLGASLIELVREADATGRVVPVPIAAAVMAGTLRGVHAAHQATDEFGKPLGIVHRDLSPHNILIGVDGHPRVLDLGCAKAVGRIQSTRSGQIKGKISYMSPEQTEGGAVRQTDVYAAGACLWEALTSKRLFEGENDAEVLKKVIAGGAPAPSQFVMDHGGDRERADAVGQLDLIVLRALAHDPAARFDTAEAMALAIERSIPIASAGEVGAWVETMLPDLLAERRATIAAIERGTAVNLPPAPVLRALSAGIPLLERVSVRTTSELDDSEFELDASPSAGDTASSPGSPGTPRTPGSPGTPRTPGSPGTPHTPGSPGTPPKTLTLTSASASASPASASTALTALTPPASASSRRNRKTALTSAAAVFLLGVCWLVANRMLEPHPDDAHGPPAADATGAVLEGPAPAQFPATPTSRAFTPLPRAPEPPEPPAPDPPPNANNANDEPHIDHHPVSPPPIHHATPPQEPVPAPAPQPPPAPTWTPPPIAT